MSGRYTADGKRKSSQVHANRTWTCPCGRTVRGNGGKSSHQRACPVWAQTRLDATEKALISMADGTWGGRLSPGLVANYRHQYEIEAARLQERLATTTSAVDKPAVGHEAAHDDAG